MQNDTKTPFVASEGREGLDEADQLERMIEDIGENEPVKLTLGTIRNTIRILRATSGASLPGAPRPMKLKAEISAIAGGFCEMWIYGYYENGLRKIVSKDEGVPLEKAEEIAYRINAFEAPGAGGAA